MLNIENYEGWFYDSDYVENYCLKYTNRALKTVCGVDLFLRVLLFSTLKLKSEFIPSFGRRIQSSNQENPCNSTSQLFKTLTRQYGFDRSLSEESAKGKSSVVDTRKNFAKLMVSKASPFTSYLDETDSNAVPKTVDEAKHQRVQCQEKHSLSYKIHGEESSESQYSEAGQRKNLAKQVVAKKPSFTSYLDETDSDIVPKTVDEAKLKRVQYQRKRLLSYNSYRSHWRTSMPAWQRMAANVPGMAYAFDFLQKLG